MVTRDVRKLKKLFRPSASNEKSPPHVAGGLLKSLALTLNLGNGVRMTRMFFVVAVLFRKCRGR
jgi:hypothetical protein